MEIKKPRMVQYFMQSSFHISLYLCILVCILEIALHIAMTSINLQYPILVSVLDGAITSLLCFPLFYFGLQFFLELKQDKLKIQELALQNQNSILEAQYIALQNQNISLQEKNLALQNQNASLQKQEQELKFKEIEEKNQEVYKLINQCEKRPRPSPGGARAGAAPGAPARRTPPPRRRSRRRCRRRPPSPPRSTGVAPATPGPSRGWQAGGSPR